MNEPEFRYKARTYAVFNAEDAEKMRADIEKMFNDGWRPTTNGPCLAVMMDKHVYPEGQDRVGGVYAKTVEQSTWLLMYVFAKERPHAHN